ncbi:MAG: hypothetical protein ACREAA_04415, partial [Candidatus Polarisedimenticolia bacterium]
MSFAHAVVARALPEPGRPSSPSPWEVGETARPYRTERSLGQAHQVAVSLAAARARVILPLAKVAATVVAGRAHREFGYSSLEDFCRERHGRGARCVRDLAVLQGHFEKLPALAAAVSGDDGGPPLHVSAAMAIGSVATPENVDRWIARGREVTLDHLKKEIRAQAGADAVEPDRVQVRMSVHPVVLAVFDEVLDLHRAVVGSEGSVTSFVESMVAEAMTEPEPSALAGLEGRTDALVRGADPAVAEEAREKAAGGWADLPRSGKGSWALRLAGSSLKQLEGLMKVAGTGDARRLDRQLGQLLRLQNALELRLGETLREMGEMRGWDRLGFEDAGHYAERILSMSRTSAEDRVWVAGAIRPFALVRQAYERGELTWEATRSVLRLMQGCVGSDLEGQKKWIEHGRACTVKRLRDEAKARRRSLALEPAKPMSDEA